LRCIRIYPKYLWVKSKQNWVNLRKIALPLKKLWKVEMSIIRMISSSSTAQKCWFRSSRNIYSLIKIINSSKSPTISVLSIIARIHRKELLMKLVRNYLKASSISSILKRYTISSKKKGRRKKVEGQFKPIYNLNQKRRFYLLQHHQLTLKNKLNLS